MRKLNNRYKRGIAMEMAIGMMLTMVALSIILVTISMIQIKNRQYDLTSFEEKILEYQAEELTDGESVDISVNGKKYKLEKAGDELKKTELSDHPEQ